MNQFGLIGKSLGHSFSPGYFHKKFSSERIQAQYGAFELEHIEAFPSLLQHVPALKGLNVTIPYKEAVIPYLDELSPEAAEIGAVNTIAIAASGYLKGYNTDVIGFRDSLEAAWAGEPMQQAVVLGTGGASKAVCYVLREKLGLKRPLIVSRNPTHGQLGYPDLNMLRSEDFDLVVNTTPLGTYPRVQEAPPFTYDILRPHHLIYDLVYNPAETLFLKKAKEQGANIINGYPMLVRQAEAAWEIWQQEG